MTVRRDRVARVARIAGESEAKAKAVWVEADHRVRLLDRRRDGALARADQLSDESLPIGLRIHLVDAGARHLVALAGEKVGLVEEARRRRAEFEEAVVKVRSLDRLVERLDETERDRRQRREAADLQDIVAIRAAADKVARRIA